MRLASLPNLFHCGEQQKGILICEHSGIGVWDLKEKALSSRQTK
jgi:hypothetical protein